MRANSEQVARRVSTDDPSPESMERLAWFALLDGWKFTMEEDSGIERTYCFNIEGF